MDQIVAALSNSQVWTVALSGLAALCASLAPIVIARFQAVQAAKVAAAEVLRAAHTASATLKATARKDAVEEWQKLYGEREKEVKELRTEVYQLRIQNADQQAQLNEHKMRYEDCEQRHAALEHKVESLTKTVTKVANGNQ